MAQPIGTLTFEGLQSIIPGKFRPHPPGSITTGG